MPLRFRSPRVLVDRRPRPCRRAGDRSAPRGHGRAGGSRARTATTANPGGAATSARRWRTTPSKSATKTSPPLAVRSSGPVTPGARFSSWRPTRRVLSPTGQPSTTAIDPSPRQFVTCGQYGWHSQERRIEIVDLLETTGGHAFRLAFHFGPDIHARMVEHGRRTHLVERQLGETVRRSTCPSGPSWSLSRGESDPVLGWYSSRFGEKEPAWTVVGEGTCSGRPTGYLDDRASVHSRVRYRRLHRVRVWPQSQTK